MYTWCLTLFCEVYYDGHSKLSFLYCKYHVLHEINSNGQNKARIYTHVTITWKVSCTQCIHLCTHLHIQVCLFFIFLICVLHIKICTHIYKNNIYYMHTCMLHPQHTHVHTYTCTHTRAQVYITHTCIHGQTHMR